MDTQRCKFKEGIKDWMPVGENGEDMFTAEQLPLKLWISVRQQLADSQPAKVGMMALKGIMHEVRCTCPLGQEPYSSHAMRDM